MIGLKLRSFLAFDDPKVEAAYRHESLLRLRAWLTGMLWFQWIVSVLFYAVDPVLVAAYDNIASALIVRTLVIVVPLGGLLLWLRSQPNASFPSAYRLGTLVIYALQLLHIPLVTLLVEVAKPDYQLAVGALAFTIWSLVGSSLHRHRVVEFAILTFSGAVGATLSLQYKGVFALTTAGLLTSLWGFVALLGLLTASTVAIVSFIEIGDRERFAQKRRADALLANVFPASIANILQREEEAPPQRFASATVVFADLVGFTELSTDTDPEALVALLDDIFLSFDRLADKHGIEKIKTIGDAYMAVAGVPEPRPDHATAATAFAVELRDRVLSLDPVGDRRLSIRVGVHTGSVVAGVIGERRLAYDIWGDTVNVASRMESHGAPGRVQVSADTRALLTGAYEFEPRELQVKGKGRMTAYFVEPSPAPPGDRHC